VILCSLDSPLGFVRSVVSGRDVLEAHGGLLGSEERC